MLRALVIAATGIASQSAAAQVIDRLDAVGPVLDACIEKRIVRMPISGQREVTFLVSFRRDGTIIGAPRRTHSFPAADQSGQAELIAAVGNAIMACAPLPFSKTMGEATAGRPYKFRYIFKPQQDQRL